MKQESPAPPPSPSLLPPKDLHENTAVLHECVRCTMCAVGGPGRSSIPVTRLHPLINTQGGAPGREHDQISAALSWKVFFIQQHFSWSREPTRDEEKDVDGKFICNYLDTFYFQAKIQSIFWQTYQSFTILINVWLNFFYIKIYTNIY